MARMMFVIAIVAIGCKQKPADEMGASSGQSGAMGPAGAMGSAMGTTMHDAAPGTPPVDAATPKTDDEIAKRYDECIRLQNENSPDASRGCFIDLTGLVPFSDVEKLRREPQLVMISDRTVIAVVLVTGVKIKTQKPAGHLVSHVIATDPLGTFTDVRTFVDPKPTTKAWPTKLALIAKTDDVEKANLAALPQRGERTWAAGEYVAQIANGDLAVYRFANGKIAETWKFSR